jgi:hypothetical protein
VFRSTQPRRRRSYALPLVRELLSSPALSALIFASADQSRPPQPRAIPPSA